MFSFTKEQLTSHQDARNCYICGKRILKKLAKRKHYQKVRDIAIILVNIEAQNIVFVI